MPQLMLPLNDIEEMVVAPVVKDVITQLMHATRLNKNASVFIPGAEERIPILNNSINQKGKDVATFPHTDMLMVDVTETIEDDSVLTRVILKPEQPPVFHDKELGILIKPVYTHTRVELSVSSRFRDKASALRWRKEMQNKISMMRQTIHHTATYSYIIPIPYINILHECWRLREEQAGYQQTFTEYWDAHRTPNTTELTNVGGLHERKGVKETQQRIQGWFDFDRSPERGGKEGDADAWTISFTYTFEYDKPAGCVMKYPVMIHNQVLDQKYRPDLNEQPSYQPNRVNRTFGESIQYLHQFEIEQDYMYLKNSQKGIQVPDFDEFVPEWVPEGTWRVVTYLIQLMPDDQVDLVSIRDLPETEGLSPVLHKFMMESELPFMTDESESVFHIQVYEDCQPLSNKLYRINEDGNVLATRNYSLRKTYHVRFGVYWNWSLLSEAAIERLRRHPDVVRELLKHLFPNHEEWLKGDIDTVRDLFIPRSEMDRIIDTLMGRSKTYGIMPIQQSLGFHALRFEENDQIIRAKK